MPTFPDIGSVPRVEKADFVPYDRRQGDTLLRTLWALYRTSKSMRQPYEGMWQQYWDGWRGTLTLDDTGRKPKHYFNQLWKLTEQVVAGLTESLPKWMAKPREEGDEELAAVAEAFLQWTMKNARAAGPLQAGVRNGEVCGTGIWKTPWNPDANRGRGANELWACDPLRMYFDLTKTRLDEMSFIIQEYFLDTAYIRRRWGVDIAAISEFSDFDLDGGVVGTANRTTVFGTAHMPTIYGQPEGTLLTGRTRVIECWLRDFALESTGIALPEPQREAAKYPDWYLVYAVQGQLLPVSKESKDKDGLVRVPYRKPPYAIYRPMVSESQFYGISPMHPLLDPQRDYLEGREQLREHRRRHTQPWITIDPRYEVDPQTLGNRDNPIPVPPGAIAYLLPPALGSEVILATNMAAADMEDISGIHDVARGQRVPQLTAGVAISALQQKAQVRINARLPLLAEACIEIGENSLYNGAVHWGLGGLLRVAGQLGIDVSKIDSRSLQADAAEVLDMDIDVEVGNYAAERADLRERVAMLAQAQVLPPEVVIELLELPHAHRYIRMIEDRQKQSLAMQAAQQQAPQPQGQAPNPYSDESIVGAQSPDQLPQELQAVLALIAEHLGPEVADGSFRGIQRERAQALAERQVATA